MTDHVTSEAVSDVLLPELEEGKVTRVYQTLVFIDGEDLATNATENTIVDLFTLPNRARVVEAVLSVDASLGTDVTLQIVSNEVAAGTASTATSAGVYRNDATFPPVASDGTHIVGLLVGGDDVDASGGDVTVKTMVGYVLT